MLATTGLQACSSVHRRSSGNASTTPSVRFLSCMSLGTQAARARATSRICRSRDSSPASMVALTRRSPEANSTRTVRVGPALASSAGRVSESAGEPSPTRAPGGVALDAGSDRAGRQCQAIEGLEEAGSKARDRCLVHHVLAGREHGRDGVRSSRTALGKASRLVLLHVGDELALQVFAERERLRHGRAPRLLDAWRDFRARCR